MASPTAVLVATLSRGIDIVTALHTRARPWLSAVAVLALVAVPTSVAFASNSNGKQTICHRTNSNTKPYVVITPNKNGDVSGHARHTGPVWTPALKAAHIKWGDIIPPFDFNNHGTAAHFAGLNWDANGQAWFNNHCRVPITATVDKTNDANGDGTFTDDETATSVGADVPFKVVITNTSVVPAVLSSLTDEVGGSNVAFDCTPAVLGSTLAAGASVTCLVTLAGYSPADGGIKVDTVTATLHAVNVPTNSGSASDSSTVRTAVPLPDISIVKTGQATAAPGDTLVWTETVHNDGTVDATGVAVTDTLPTGTTLVSATGTDWTCTGTTDLSCTLATTLAVGASSVLTVSATIDAAFTGTTISNTAVVTPTDVTPADNTSTFVTTVTQPTAGGGGTTVTPTPTPFTGGGGGVHAGLPFTGFPTALMAGIALAALLAGGGLLLLTPRRVRS